ncbi:MAG: hypothetical protein J6C49_03780 [Elusimicrobiaceae bacterium]|nr:hypothetical protein [Elusimicrobiaceae bacterium]
MKKLISVFTMMFLCSLSYAESMKFITVLSSPVGTFNKLEAVDPTSSAYGKTINFCTNIGTQGVVELKGTKPAALTTVSLARNTTLGKTDEGKFSLNNIILKQGGSIRGGRLFANTVTVNNAASGKANNLYGNHLTVAGAKTKTLDVNGGDSNITTQHAAADMVWSNEYQSDTACGNAAACAKQYLLKEKGAVITNKCPQTAGDPRTWWDESTQQCGCPNANEYYHNGACCSSSTPKTNTKCWKKTTSESGNKLVWKNVLASERFDTQNIANMGVTRLTCSQGGALGFTGTPKTTKKCPHYSCSGSCVLPCNSSGGGGGIGPVTPTPNPTTDELGLCNTEGDICVARLHISTNDAECTGTGGKFLWCATTYTYSSCVKSTSTTPSYEQLWDATDTRYGCGH